MNYWDISETEAPVSESGSTRLSYEGVANSESNVSLSLYQTGKRCFSSAVLSPDETWVKDYMEQFGREPSFF